MTVEMGRHDFSSQNVFDLRTELPLNMRELSGSCKQLSHELRRFGGKESVNPSKSL